MNVSGVDGGHGGVRVGGAHGGVRADGAYVAYYFAIVAAFASDFAFVVACACFVVVFGKCRSDYSYYSDY